MRAKTRGHTRKFRCGLTFGLVNYIEALNYFLHTVLKFQYVSLLPDLPSLSPLHPRIFTPF